MTRRRRLPLVSRVCIGVFLLLFSNVAADTIKGPPTILKKAHPAESDAITLQKNRTLHGGVSTANRTYDLASSLDDDRSIDLSDRSSIEGLVELDKPAKDAKADSNKEKVPTSAERDSEVQGIRSHDDANGSSASDSTNGSSRYEEIVYGTSGKSSSTKAVTEDTHRLFRTNGLATGTTKPSFEDSSAKNEEKQQNRDTKDETTKVTTEGLLQETTKSRNESRDSESENVLSRLEVRDKTNVSRLKNEGYEEEEDERESTTPRGYVEESKGRKKTEAKESKHTEVTDLEKVDDEKKENGEAISLINDTYVNYSHYYKTTAGKKLEADAGNQSRVLENGTNFISEDGAVSHGRQDPKEEVEVVGNVTHTPIQRIVADGQIAGNQSSSAARNASRLENELEGTKGSYEKDEKDEKNVESNVDSAKTNGYLNGNGKQKRVNGKDDQSRSTEVGATRGNEKNEEETTTGKSNGPVPRGRTIEFSGVNEFPSSEAKTTVSSSKEIDAPTSKKNTSVDKSIDQKPYPYVRNGKESSSDSNTRSNVERREETTEESSAFENTIGRGQSEKKFIVTEPSVVIENSIQQFKPTYYEKSSNNSTNSTVGSQSTVSMTTKSLEEVRPTNETFHVDSLTDPRTINDKSEKGSTSSVENDVPRGNEGSKVITGKEENFDVTGNGITEVNSKAESSDDGNKRASYVPGFSAEENTVNRTTEFSLIIDSTMKPQTESKILSGMDVQTDAEESLLIRSTLNVTELSTEYPLTKEKISENSKLETSNSSLRTTTNPSTRNTSVLDDNTKPEKSVGNDTVDSSEAKETNGTNESSSVTVVTLNPDETSIPTTTSVEYEFVGLSESTVLPSQVVTERTVEAEVTEERTEGNVSTVSVQTVQDLSTNNSTNEDVVTTSNHETVTENSTMNVETETTIVDDKPFSVPGTDRTLIPTTMQTTMSVEEISTGSTIAEDQTDQTITREDDNDSTIGVNDSWSTTEESIVTTGDTESPSTNKGQRPHSNDTEASTSTTESGISNVTSTTRSSMPFVPSSLKPRILDSSTVSTSSTSGSDSSTERTTDATQTLSPDEITSLVRIVMKGTWHEVCPHLETLRFTLAGILKSGMNKSVYAKQIMFHQNPCLEPPSPAPTPTDDPLTSILVYVVDENGKFDSEMTNILPRLYTNSSVNFPVTIHSFLLVQETDSGNAIAVVVVSSVAFICLVLLAGLLFIMRKRQTRFNYGERCRPVSLDAYSLDSVSAYNSVRRKGVARSSKRSYGNPTFEDSSAIPSHPLNFAGLSSFCNDVNAINEEFSGIPQVSAKIDELPAGAELKNRYANVIPLPETRVPLQKMNNDPLTEYINASYVRGPKNATRYYIACQGPMESTVTDFWRMIWEQQCKVIIMLTDLVENGVEKCTEYIPPSEVTDCHRLYGDYQVTLKKRETKEKYAISTLHLKNLENNTYREVYHIWYLWPVNGVQSDGAGLIAVLLEARALQRGGPVPIVVHCSPGTGRTGTLIALDLGIRQYEITRTVDVPRVVYTIRRDRAGAVQTKEQYAFIYKALNLYATKLAGGVLEST